MLGLMSGATMSPIVAMVERGVCTAKDGKGARRRDNGRGACNTVEGEGACH